MVGDRWTISYQKAKTLVLWPTDELDRFSVLLIDSDAQSFRILARGLDLGYAQGVAEESIRRYGSIHLSRHQGQLALR